MMILNNEGGKFACIVTQSYRYFRYFCGVIPTPIFDILNIKIYVPTYLLWIVTVRSAKGVVCILYTNLRIYIPSKPNNRIASVQIDVIMI